MNKVEAKSMPPDLEVPFFTGSTLVLHDIFQEPAHIFCHGAQNPQFNMDFDYHYAVSMSQSMEILPMLRLYAWQPWAISLGMNQKAYAIDEQEVSRRNWAIVRRPTGGRAVFHADEITYCVVTRLHNRTKEDIYKIIHLYIAAALQKIFREMSDIVTGEHLSFEKSQPNFAEHYRENSASVACFSAAARYEIEWKGRKVVGSAQRLMGDIVLQHGSILLGNSHERLCEVVSVASEQEREQLQKMLRLKAVSLSEIAQRNVQFHEVQEILLEFLIDNM